MPLKTSERLNRYHFLMVMAVDFFTVAACLAAALKIRFGSLLTVPSDAIIGTWIFFSVMQMIFMLMEDLYTVRSTVNRTMNIFRTIRMTVMITLLYIVALFVLHFPSSILIVSRLAILIFMVLWLGVVIFTRLFLLPRLFSVVIRLLGFKRITVLIFGEKKAAEGMKSNLRRSRAYRSVLNIETAEPVRGGGDFQQMKTLMEERDATECMVVFQDEGFDEMADLIIRVTDASIPLCVFSPRFLELGYFDPWLSTSRYGAMVFCRRKWGRMSELVWRFLDVAAAILGFLLFLPVTAPTAAAVALSGKGGVFFRQERIGKDKKPFTFLKFRSMRVEDDSRQKDHKEYFARYANGNAAEKTENGKIYKSVSSSSVTKVGKVIRKTSIDELPQILNVLRGDMSIVGPRPCIEYELEHYDKQWYHLRFDVKPGLTGIWQVYGRSRLSFEKSQFLDFVYVLSRTDGMNIKLIFKTFPVMLFGKGGL